MREKRGLYKASGFLFAALLLIGCNIEERLFNALDVDVFATDGFGNPTELLVTDMGKDGWPCGEPQDSKIMRIDLDGNPIWEYDRDTDLLEGAHNADLNDAGDQMIISDMCHDRVLVIRYPERDILWNSSVHCPELDLKSPNDADFLGQGWDDGNILITVRDAAWVIEVDPAQCDGVRNGEIVWSFGLEDDPRGQYELDDPLRLFHVHNADRLTNGNTILCDSGPQLLGPSRVIEIGAGSNRIVWSYKPEGDCTVKGRPDQGCPGLVWARDADVVCDAPQSPCEQGMVVVTGMHQTVGVRRDLTEDEAPGESAPRGREVVYQVQHGTGLTYDSDKIPRWNGGENGGLGYFLVSNHSPYVWGMWLRVVRVDAETSYPGSNEWELRSFR
jgi:hypothetical protein